MCGLILAPDSFSPLKIQQALAMMAYRGDFQAKLNVVTKFGWNVGHVRLAIQNISDDGMQPFEEKHSVTAFVGEFFNPWDGERNMLMQGLHTDNFHYVDGFWAVAHVNVFGARVYTDYLSTKPLYYWAEHGIVCSEIFPMFALVDKPAFDEIYLSNCIKFGYDYSGRTPFVGITQIAPGTRLDLPTNSTSEQQRTYWHWDQVAPGVLEADWRTTIDGAIISRLTGERQVAMLLSGGLDSSIIYYSLKNLGAPIRTFAIENGESEYLPPGVDVIKPDPVSIQEAVRIMQAPLDLGSLVPQVQLAQAVHNENYPVIMTGDGADELFGGYSRAAHYDSQSSDVFCELPYYHLPRLDRVMMRSGIELRSPFLSPRVIAKALRLPQSERTSKQVLKTAYADIVPSRIINRKKHPLKTLAVIQGGIEYRNHLVEEFRNVSQDL